jgi:hypothetical protein
MRAAMIRAALVAAALPALAAAQEPAGRWAPWVGCWAPVGDAPGTIPVTCVVPSGPADAVDLVTIVGDSVVQRSTITADGVTRPIDADGCRGSEAARFSEDGSRVFVSGEVRCGDGVIQRTSGIMSISETGQWVDVHGIQVGAQHSVRARRSKAAIMPAALPDAMRRAIAASARAVSGARLAAASPLSVARVIETAGDVSDRVTEAWLLESSRDASPFAPVDAKGLARLEAAGVPSRVIDVVVALGYPRHFQVALAEDGRGDVMPTEDERAAGSAHPGRPLYGDVVSYSLYGHPRCYTYSCYRYYSDLGYYHYGLAGWNTYGGWGMYPGWGYNQPIIIVRPSDGGGSGGGTPSPGGRAEKGAGYRRNGDEGGTAQPRAATQDASSRSGSQGSSRGSSGSSGSAGSGTRSSGGEAKGEAKPREAKPRKP